MDNSTERLPELFKSLANSRVVVPASTWKVILVLEAGEQATPKTRTIAVRIPNSEKVASSDWRDYLVSVDEVERATGYNFFPTLPVSVQKQIESKVDNSIVGRANH